MNTREEHVMDPVTQAEQIVNSVIRRDGNNRALGLIVALLFGVLFWALVGFLVSWLV